MQYPALIGDWVVLEAQRGIPTVTTLFYLT